MPKKKVEPKVFDVAKPGKSPASPTSRPVIVGHGPMATDPMMQPTGPPPVDDRLKAVTSRAKTIQPPSANPPATNVPSKPVPSQSAQQAAVPDEPEPAAPTETSTEQSAKTAKPDSQSPQQVEQDQAEKARQDATQKMIDEKTYFLPIGQVTRRRSNRRALLILLLVIVVAIVALDLLIDTKIIPSNIKLPIDLIKN